MRSMGKKARMPYANSEIPDEPAHPCSLICTFSVRRHILQYQLILLANNEGPDQPAQMRRLIWACVVHILHKVGVGELIYLVDCPPF